MNMQIDLSKTILQEEQKQAVRLFCESLTSLADLAVQSIILYGSAARTDFHPGRSDINLMVIMKQADLGTLQTVTEPVTAGRACGLAPLFLTPEDLVYFSAAFPLKYLSIQESHLPLCGDAGLLQKTISPEALRARCRQEMLNLRLRLRRNYVYALGHPLAGFLVSSIKGFLEVLRIFLYHKTGQLPPRESLLAAAENILGKDIEVIREILDMKETGMSPETAVVASIYNRYDQLVKKILAGCD